MSGHADTAYGRANTTYDRADATNDRAGTAYGRNDNTVGRADSASGHADTAYGRANTTYDRANATNDRADTAYGRKDNTSGRADSASGHADTAYGRVDSAYGRVDSAYGRVDSAYGRVDTAYGRVDTAIGQARAGTANIDGAKTRIDGAIAAAMRIEDATFRAVAPGHTGDSAAVKLTVLGSSAKTRALASGQQRRQVGLKLRAENGCNLIYVMWRLDPKPKLEVSVKRNPGERTAKECGAGGYKKVKPAFTRLDATLEDGNPHELRAEISGDTLTAWIDGRVAWVGTLPESARDLVGPAGIRSDNLSFDLASLAVDAGATSLDAAAKCVDEESDLDAPTTADR